MTILELYVADRYASVEWLAWGRGIVRCRHEIVDGGGRCLLCQTVEIWGRKR